MSLLNITSGVLLLSTWVGIYAGLDKLAGSFCFLLLLTVSHCYNSFCRLTAGENNRLVSALMRRNISRKKAQLILKASGALAVAAICFYVLINVYWLSLGYNLTVYDSFNFRIFYLAVHLLLIFYAVFAVRTMQADNKDEAMPQWYRALAYLALYQTLIFTLFIFTSYIPEAENIGLVKTVDLGFFSVFIAIALLSAEILTASVRSFRNIYASQGASELPVPFFINFFAGEETVKQSLIRSIETISGVNVARSEIVAFSLQSLEPVLIITFFAVWLTSA
ncbi:MAG: hypothetical protein PHD82_10965, partial [Candidatus Riflebacteria bacterium]|nr:hypothetical protein [Candidatus Riflebacteria bacterium]